LRAQVARTVPDRYTKVQAGTRIINQGERVTSRHITMVQAMKQAIYEERKLSNPLSIFASACMALILVTISALYFRISQLSFIRSLQQIALFVCIVLITLVLAKLTEYTLLKSTPVVIEAARYPIIAPFADHLDLHPLCPLEPLSSRRRSSRSSSP